MHGEIPKLCFTSWGKASGFPREEGTFSNEELPQSDQTWELSWADSLLLFCGPRASALVLWSLGPSSHTCSENYFQRQFEKGKGTGKGPAAFLFLPKSQRKLTLTGLKQKV